MHKHQNRINSTSTTASTKSSLTLTQVRLASRREGFTLIELLVVISIISLLSTVVFAVFSTSRVQAQDVAKKETVHSVQQALELYHGTTGTYPNNYTCTSADSCIVGRANPAVQGDTTGGGDWAYKKSMQELVDAKVLPSVPESNSGAGYAYYNTGDSAVFFTGLNGGYSEVTVGQTWPVILKTGAYGRSETGGTSSCSGNYCSFYSGSVVFYYQKDLCFFDTVSQLSEEYKNCLSVGPVTYGTEKNFDINCATPITCDSFFRPPGGFSPDWPSCTDDGGLKYMSTDCTVEMPSFCVDNESYTNDYCYWSQ